MVWLKIPLKYLREMLWILTPSSDFSLQTPASRHPRLTERHSCCIRQVHDPWVKSADTNSCVVSKHILLSSLATNGFLETSWNHEAAELKLQLIQSRAKPVIRSLHSASSYTAHSLASYNMMKMGTSLFCAGISAIVELGWDVSFDFVKMNLSYALSRAIFVQWVKHTHPQHLSRNS